MDILYILLLVPAMIFAGLATLLTKTTFQRYSRVRSRSGVTGAGAAQKLLDRAGVHDVRIEEVGGFLSDHYDPRSRTLRLSPGVYASDSLSAIGVACHEAGHALQHAAKYGPLGLRTALVPAMQIGSYAPYAFFLLGALTHFSGFILAGIAIFLLAFVFSLVTLPVEWNASARARELMVSAGIISAQERDAAARVLNAAFLTYVAAAVAALLQLLYYLVRFGLIGGRRN